MTHSVYNERVPRSRAPERLEQIVDSALAAFGSVGYRRTRMSDVAAGAGVSPGLLYSYADSKEALFALEVQRESGVDISELELPVANPATAELTALLRTAFADLSGFAALEAAMAVERPSDIEAEIAGIVSEHFDAVLGARTLLRLVERCALDWPVLAGSFYDKGRRPQLTRLAEYLDRRRREGLLAPIADVGVAARFIVETVAWFAYHRYGDHDGANLADDAVRAEVVALITRALTAR